MRPRHIILCLGIAGSIALNSATAFAQEENGDVTASTNDAESYATAQGTFIFGDGGRPVPYAPGAVTAPVTSPTLFNLQGLPAQIKGFPVITSNFFSTVYHDVSKGKSGGTKIIYNAAKVKGGIKKKDRKIYFDFDGMNQGEVVGSITIQSRKTRADEVDIPTLIYDATNYIDDVRELRKFDVTLLSTTNNISYTLGVDTDSEGLAVSPYATGFVNGAAGALTGLLLGGSKSGGVTVPTATLGCTFLVLVDSEENRRVNLTGQAPEDLNLDENGNQRKKFEVIRE